MRRDNQIRYVCIYYPMSPICVSVTKIYVTHLDLTTEILLLIPDVTHELNALSNIRYRNGSSSWHVLRNNRHIETECTPVYMVIRQRRGRDTPWWTYSKYNSHCSIFFFGKASSLELCRWLGKLRLCYLL